MIINILNNKSTWRLLALMSYSPGSGYYRHELKKLLVWNNVSLDRTIDKLLFYSILIKERRVIKLNFENPETELLLEIIKQDKKKMNFPTFELLIILTDFLSLIENKREIEGVYLFGSQAKKTAHLKSDIDIAVFSNTTVNLIEAKDKILQDYDKNIELHYFKKTEKGPLVTEILKTGIKIK